MDESTTKIFEDAMRLVSGEPPPPNVFDILEEMRKNVPDEYKAEFDELGEAAVVSGANP